MREERHEQRVVEKILGRLGAVQIHVQRITHGREGIKRNAYRQHDVELGRLVDHTEARHQQGKIFEHESAVLEIGQHAEIGHDREQHPCASRVLILGVNQLLRRIPIDDRRYPQQDHERRIPRRIKKITGDQQVALLCRPAERHRVHRKHACKEHHERE